jgi:hypothetical protein
MFYFAQSHLIPYIVKNKYRLICEIGASHGQTTDKLLEIDDLSVTIIDPCLDADLRTKYKNNSRVQMHKGLSLHVLEKLSEPFDCILIDGDHNWYTVFNELRIIHERNLLKQEGTILLHDVTWPYGRRDMYYQPDTIPEQFKHPYQKMGMLYGKSNLATTGINSHHYNALHSDGPRNGILTAIEDFLNSYKRNYSFFYLKSQNGLGFIYKRKGSLCSMSYYKLFLKSVCFYNPSSTLKNIARSQCPGLYTNLKLLRDTIYRKLS